MGSLSSSCIGSIKLLTLIGLIIAFVGYNTFNAEAFNAFSASTNTQSNISTRHFDFQITPVAETFATKMTSKSVLAIASDGSSTYLVISGAINGSDISNAFITKNQAASKTTIDLTLIGDGVANSFCNITVPKNAVFSATTPIVYINNLAVANQSYVEDENNFFVWYYTNSNSYNLTLIFSGNFVFPLWPIPIIILISVILIFIILWPKLRFQQHNSTLLSSNKVIIISNYKITKDFLNFYRNNGLINKKSKDVKTIPLAEISNTEVFWDNINITWNGITNTFSKRGDYESFTELANKLQPIIDNNKKLLEIKEKQHLRNNEITHMVNTTISIVDPLFNILMGLSHTQIDWESIDATCNTNLSKELIINTKTLPPLVLDFTQLSVAVSKRFTPQVATDAYKLLRSIHEYFNALSPEDDFIAEHPNFKDATALIIAYYILNDILLGKLVNDEDNSLLNRSLENLLNKLVDETNFKVNLEELKAAINNFNGDIENAVTVVRAIFKGPLSQF